MLTRSCWRSLRALRRTRASSGSLNSLTSVRVMLHLCKFLCVVRQIGKSIKIHLYWAMKNCGASPDTVQQLIVNVPKHYEVSRCFVIICFESRCRVTIPTVPPSLHATHLTMNPVRTRWVTPMLLSPWRSNSRQHIFIATQRIFVV